MFKTTEFSKVNIGYGVKFLAMMLMATGAPLIGVHSQWFTGPIVNAALILSVYVLGIRGALLIGVLPSTIALGTGLLPVVLAPMIPFIIISNTLLVLVIEYFERAKIGNYWVGLTFGAGVKYLFLYLTSGIVIGLLLKSSLATTVASMMSWPQFFTAMLGGVTAWGVLKIINK